VVPDAPIAPPVAPDSGPAGPRLICPPPCAPASPPPPAAFTGSTPSPLMAMFRMWSTMFPSLSTLLVSSIKKIKSNRDRSGSSIPVLALSELALQSAYGVSWRDARANCVQAKSCRIRATSGSKSGPKRATRGAFWCDSHPNSAFWQKRACVFWSDPLTHETCSATLATARSRSPLFSPTCRNSPWDWSSQ